MSKSILSSDATYLDLNKPSEFQKFFIGLIELLEKKLQRIDFFGSGHYYYTCGEIHDRCNHNWNPFGHNPYIQLFQKFHRTETTSDRLKQQFKNILKIYSSLPESGF